MSKTQERVVYPEKRKAAAHHGSQLCYASSVWDSTVLHWRQNHLMPSWRGQRKGYTALAILCAILFDQNKLILSFHALDENTNH